MATAPKDDDVEERMVPVGADTEVEVEIVDDTPAEDRGKKQLSRDVLDPTDDEVEQYSERVKKRIEELTHARHDERREKETIAREREELARFAQALVTENQHLKSGVASAQSESFKNAQERANKDLEQARKDLKEAHDAFDTDKIVAAQESLAEAKFRVERLKNFRPRQQNSGQDGNNGVEQRQSRQSEPVQTVPTPDERALLWQAKNQWFSQPGFEEPTSYALGLHAKLVNNGVDPRSDDYYDQINDRLKSKFPEVFGETDTHSGSAGKKPNSVVAPATRSSGPTKIRLTATQVNLAKKFGLTPQQYAAQVAALEK